MFEVVGRSVPLVQGKAFVQQTGAVVYAAPSTESEIVGRLYEGAPVEILPDQSDGQAGWLCVRMSAGHQGFLRASTYLTTREQLLAKRAALLRSLKIGRTQMAIGSVICLSGCAVTVFSLILADKSKAETPLYFFYGAVIAGGGQFLWGLEQMANSRHTLKHFDALWKEAMA